MNTSHVIPLVPMKASFCSLSELMPSSCSHNHTVAYHGQEMMTWAAFRADVHRLVERLLASPLQKWALCFDDSYYFAVAFMAAAHAGKHIILPGNHQPEALVELERHFDAILHDRAVFEHLDCQQIVLPAAVNSTQRLESEPVYTFSSLILGECCLTLFTSGSSGQPKAIEKNLALVAIELNQLEHNWGAMLADSHIVSTVSHQHIYGLLFRVLWPLCAGRAFARLDAVYPEQIMAQANSNTTLITSPALLKRMTDVQPTQPYRAIFSSGGPLSALAAQYSHALFEQWPIEVFGSTETGGIAFRQQREPNTPWQVFEVIDVTLNAERCLRIRSPFVDSHQWYQTSDQCQLLNDRQFILQGRVDRVVKIEEKRISLVEVERRLCQLPWIDEAAVLVLEDHQRKSIGAVVTLNDEGQQCLIEWGKGKFWLAIRQALRRWLEPVGVPRRYRVVEEIPLNSQGKRLVRDLEQLF